MKKTTLLMLLIAFLFATVPISCSEDNARPQKVDDVPVSGTVVHPILIPVDDPSCGSQPGCTGFWNPLSAPTHGVSGAPSYNTTIMGQGSLCSLSGDGTMGRDYAVVLSTVGAVGLTSANQINYTIGIVNLTYDDIDHGNWTSLVTIPSVSSPNTYYYHLWHSDGSCTETAYLAESYSVLAPYVTITGTETKFNRHSSSTTINVKSNTAYSFNQENIRSWANVNPNTGSAAVNGRNHTFSWVANNSGSYRSATKTATTTQYSPEGSGSYVIYQSTGEYYCDPGVVCAVYRDPDYNFYSIIESGNITFEWNTTQFTGSVKIELRLASNNSLIHSWSSVKNDGIQTFNCPNVNKKPVVYAVIKQESGSIIQSQNFTIVG